MAGMSVSRVGIPLRRLSSPQPLLWWRKSITWPVPVLERSPEKPGGGICLQVLISLSGGTALRASRLTSRGSIRALAST